MDLINILKSVAPGLATAVAGPLGGMAVKAIAEVNHLENIGEQQRHMVAAALDGIFNGEKTMRYETCDWLTGHTSTKKMSAAQIKALLKIMDIADFEAIPCQNSIQEMRWAHEAALIAKGQKVLPGMDGQA